MPIQKNWGGNETDLNSRGLPKPQRNAVIILAAFAVFIIIFWVWQMNAHIKGPFDYQTATTTDTSEEDFNKLLKTMDTDKDGLSDYDEIYVYKTSPYLEDTDSDGISDKKEVDNGTDPLCPQGKDCSGQIDTSAVATSTASDISSTTTTDTAAVASSSASLDTTGVDESILQNVLNGQGDAATLRQFLISGGASKEDLDQISDEDLMKSYQETLNAQSTSASSSQ
ncbi:MAG: hypothetical protein WC719_03880 [Patescibacteria group bacterium]